MLLGGRGGGGEGGGEGGGGGGTVGHFSFPFFHPSTIPFPLSDMLALKGQSPKNKETIPFPFSDIEGGIYVCFKGPVFQK